MAKPIQSYVGKAKTIVTPFWVFIYLVPTAVYP
jgi:hypothetical protein